ncbi:unnamed protein product [Prorocentrum cordatum]|uniref:Uncharacterized protein n=1 Tax=Prorocentrum cordatum TaxID=2364126 RepID=A0ABN9TPA0_9DINO|nr:unnamed protein product [Polarella glacialis]
MFSTRRFFGRNATRTLPTLPLLPPHSSFADLLKLNFLPGCSALSPVLQRSADAPLSSLHWALLGPLKRLGWEEAPYPFFGNQQHVPAVSLKSLFVAGEGSCCAVAPDLRCHLHL